VDQAVTGRGKIDDALFDDLEETLLAADLSVKTSERVLRSLRGEVQAGRLQFARSA
jgi:signal recognition particle GTPase